MKAGNCRVCRSVSSVGQLFSLGPQPYANKYPYKEEVASEQLHRLDVQRCEICETLMIADVVDRGVMFEDYYYLSSVNEGLVNHFSELADLLKNKNFVVDIGSNDGILLKELRDREIKFLGVDPSRNVAEIANKKGLETLVGFFNTEMVQRVKEIGSPDCLIASSVFTHVADPIQFLTDCSDLLDVDGHLIIEVEDLSAIVSDLKFERFYFDRPHYYSAVGLSLLGQKVGFNVDKVESVETHGGSLRIWFRKYSTADRQDSARGQLGSVSRESVLDGFRAWVSEGERLVAELSKMRDLGKTVVGYGAPARLATICNFFKIDESLVRLVVDDSWLKQGRLSPGTHIPIKKLDEVDMQAVDCVIIFAYEYTKQIKLKVGNEFMKSDYRTAIPYRSI